MNIIWNKDELKKIRKIILSRTDYKINAENKIVKNEDKGYFGEAKKGGNSIYNETIEELINLFYISDRNIVFNTLKRAKEIEFDKNNPLHYGLIACLSKTYYSDEPTDYTYIFEIYKNIISQYGRVITSVVEQSTKEITTYELEEKIKSIRNSDTKSEEEIEIEEIMNKIFSYTNGVADSTIFKYLIEKYNNKIKEKLIFYLQVKLVSIKKKDESIKCLDAKNHNKDFKKNYQRQNMRILKQNRGIFYH